MMSIADIIQLVVLCALLFFPAGIPDAPLPAAYSHHIKTDVL
ncbi:inner membrane protein [Klebsiella michiganensis]|nr:inner membrane protein [Klebsiella michiganensis]